VSDDLQIGAALGYFIGHDFRGADLQEDGSVETSTTNPDGLTDLVLIGKYRLLRGRPGNLALIVGVVIPTGRASAALVNGEQLSPTDQPGTGRWGLPVGFGYSRFLTPNLTMDASVLYTFRFEKDDFKVGDRLDTGLALAYRLTESIKTFPQYSLFAELNDVYLFNDRVQGENDPNKREQHALHHAGRSRAVQPGGGAGDRAVISGDPRSERGPGESGFQAGDYALFVLLNYCTISEERT